MTENATPELETMAHQYAEFWQPDADPLARIEAFLHERNIGKPADLDCRWLAKLAACDLSQAWSDWQKNILHGGRLFSQQQLLQKLESLPTAETYRPLQRAQGDSIQCWEELVISEAMARAQFGDALGPTYFKERYGVETNIAPSKPRRLRVKFDDRSQPAPSGFDVPLRGILKIGRQTAQDEPLGWSERGDETQVTIAGSQERAFSRQQLTIRLLTPDHVLITNSGSGALPPDSPAKALPPGNSQLITFPFMITLPGRKFVGS